MSGATSGLGGPSLNSNLGQLSNISANLYGTYGAGLEPAQQLYPYATQAAVPASVTTSQQAFNPYFEALNNPYYSSALGAAGSAGAVGTNVGATAYGTDQALSGLPIAQAGLGATVAGYGPQAAGLAGQAAGYAPQTAALAPQAAGMAGPITGLAPQVAAPMAGLQQAGRQLYDTSLDPQGALYNKLRQQSLDQSGALASMTGTASSPYAAGVSADALNNLNINWQNQQLQRQAQGLQGMGAADAAAASLGQTAGNLYGQGVNALQAGGGLYGQAANQLGAAGNLYGQAGSLGGLASSIYGQAPLTGSNVLGLGTGAAGAIGAGGAAPYNFVLGRDQSLLPLLGGGQNVTNQAISGLGAASQLGQSQYTLPESAGGILSNQLQLQNLINQQAGGNIGGLLGGAGSFLGGLTGSGLGGLGGLGGFFGNALGGLFGGNSFTGSLENPPAFGGNVTFQ